MPNTMRFLILKTFFPTSFSCLSNQERLKLIKLNASQLLKTF